MPRYVPKKGDLITLSFDPQTGHEQKGRRPALVISNDLFNRHTGLAIVCPITNADRGFPFHLAVPASSSLTGFVMVEQVKSVDYTVRRAKLIRRAPTEFVEDVLELIDACIR
ncbi:MAG TPA: type II toxin-antitoxin system PemK/MazF family toxin [Blastocatellia bacterium]|nr:type II toxin-antitoxin system PemK/MazF family toxin [Blastocatellia bacterium]